MRRGVDIPDYDKATHYLKYISYYRLRAYWLPFEVNCGIPSDHGFREGTSFQQIVDLYIFDRELRLLMMDAIERIEVSIRAAWAHHMAVEYGAHGYLNPNLYKSLALYNKAYDLLRSEVESSRETFIQHYNGKYSNPNAPPVWMVSEILSFGQLSKWIDNLVLSKDKKEIAENFLLDERILFPSITRHISYIRNICAHHGRLWNKKFIVTVKIPRNPKHLKSSMNEGADRNIYNTLCIIKYLLDVISPGSKWDRKLKDLVDKSDVDLSAMGFPKNWKILPLWSKQEIDLPSK